MKPFLLHTEVVSEHKNTSDIKTLLLDHLCSDLINIVINYIPFMLDVELLTTYNLEDNVHIKLSSFEEKVYMHLWPSKQHNILCELYDDKIICIGTIQLPLRSVAYFFALDNKILVGNSSMYLYDTQNKELKSSINYFSKRPSSVYPRICANNEYVISLKLIPSVKRQRVYGTQCIEICNIKKGTREEIKITKRINKLLAIDDNNFIYTYQHSNPGGTGKVVSIFSLQGERIKDVLNFWHDKYSPIQLYIYKKNKLLFLLDSTINMRIYNLTNGECLQNINLLMLKLERECIESLIVTETNIYILIHKTFYVFRRTF
jgi:hypothetical protein